MRTGRPKKSVDVECKCVGCGKKFFVKEWQAKAGRGKFCSHECYHKTPGDHHKRPTLRAQIETRQCAFCNGDFLVGGYEHRGKTRFCSNSCSTRYRYKQGILKGGSARGRMRNHEVGHFSYLNSSTVSEHVHECECSRIWICRYQDIKENVRQLKTLTTGDIYWAAGIFEGEGWSSLIKEADGRAKTQLVGVGQKGRWLCDKLRDMFGGYVSDRGIIKFDKMLGKVNYKGTHAGYSWHVHGPRARGFLMTIYKFLSPRRQEQIRRALQCEMRQYPLQIEITDATVV